jgi:hypothetical protein
MRRNSWILFAVIALLLLIAASRVLRFGGLTMNPDEVWSVWQTFGTPGQILQWTPYDWPPGYYLSLGLWRGLSGQFPIILRYLNVLILVIGLSCLFRVVNRLRGRYAALLALPIYAAFSYGIILTVEVRGYALLMGILPLALWFTLRYFDHPSLKRALPLAISLAAKLYMSLTAAGAVLILGLYTLVIYHKRIWRWWLPGLIFLILVLPLIISKATVTLNRTGATRTLTLPPIPEALSNLFRAYGGYDGSLVIWIVLALLATILILYRRARITRQTLGLALWALGGSLLMYLTHPLLAFFSPRYAWWIMLGVALWVAWGLSYLPRRFALALVVFFTVLTFAPVPFQEYNIFAEVMSPLESNFIWLKDHMLTGDVFVADPAMTCGGQEEWDYYIRTYFPRGLQFVKNPEGYRRIWYITGSAPPDVALQQKVSQDRISERFVGPATCNFRLYEAPPDMTGVLFDNGMRFHGIDVMEGDRPWSAPLVRHEGETIRLRVWWSVDRIPDLDYSINTYAGYNSNSLLTQVDGPPQLIYPPRAPQETSRWKLGQYYIEQRDLVLPFPTARGDYGLFMVIYFWGDGKRVPAPGVDENMALSLQPLRVMAY